jgi:hypothetical protein
MKKQKEITVQVAFRIPETMINEIEKIGDKVFPLQKQNTFTNQVLFVMEKGIEAYNKENK